MTTPRHPFTPRAIFLSLVTASIAIVTVAISLLASPPESDGRVTHTVSGNVETWRIDEPNVKKKIIEFQDIRFQPGDRVKVTAGGCVNRGGSGKTWKRYVDPLPASDQKYHGMVNIPGAIGQLPADSVSRFARILIIKDHEFVVKEITEPRKQHLWLGYEDDHYGDNGYTDQDEGSQGQCRIGNGWVQHAYVVVTVTHGGAPPTPTNLAPFDIAVNTVTAGNAPVDDNYILLNPMWGRQLTNRELPHTSQCGAFNPAPYSSPCTTQPTHEDHGFLCNYGTLGIVDGHHNWVAGTYEGTVFWNDKSSWIADGDYNFRVVRPDEAGMTAANQMKSSRGTNLHSMKVEFSSDETINHFGTPWWDRFHKAVDDGTPRSMIVGADGEVGTFGIVTGLIGLDCPHTCPSELHPVWAMALQVGHDPADETWAVFVRRHGNEGFCSDHQHILDDLYNDTFTFRLPWRPGATGVAVHPSTTFESERGQASMSVAVAANQGVLLSVTVPTPPPIVPNTPWLPEMVNGELHLTWTIPPGGRFRPPVGGFFTEGGGAASPVVESREDDPDDRLNRLFAAMTPAQRLTIMTKVPPPAVTRPRVAIRVAPPRQVATLPIRTARIRGPRVRAVEDGPKRELDQKRLDALHAVYGSEIPGFPRTPLRTTPRQPVVR